MSQNGDAEPVAKTSWWHTLPGILTAVAAVLTAATGLIAVLSATGIVKVQEAVPNPGSQGTPATQSAVREPLDAGSKLQAAAGSASLHDAGATSARASSARRSPRDKQQRDSEAATPSAQAKPPNPLRNVDVVMVVPEPGYQALGREAMETVFHAKQHQIQPCFSAVLPPNGITVGVLVDKTGYVSRVSVTAMRSAP